MKISKTRFFVILAIGVALVLGTSYLFMALAQTEKSEPAVPSTAAIAPEAPSLIATSPTPPEEPEKPPPPEHQLPSLVTSKPLMEKDPVHEESDVPLYTGPTLATGDDCTDPIVVNLPADLDYSDLSQTTCGRMNDYEDPAQASCLYYYDGGEDIIYELNVTSAVDLDITMDPKGLSWTGIAVDDACPPDAECIAYETNSGSEPRVLSSVHLEPGTYYIMIDSWPTPDCFEFDLTIVEGSEPQGACCNDLEPYDCAMLTEAECNVLPDHTFLGLGTTCTPNPCLPPPENDDCENAEAVGDVTNLAFSTTLATFDGQGTCLTSPNIWYLYTATCTGNVHVDLCASSYDTKMAVYDGASCDPLSPEIECNDDACYSGKAIQSEITFFGTEGNQYLIEVGGYSSNTGDGILNITCTGVEQGACCNDLDPYDCQMLTDEECLALADHTFLGIGTDCGPPNPCLPPPPNDDCETAIEIYPPDCPDVQTVYGTTVGATIDCPGVLDWYAVWYKFELTYECNDVLIDYCPSNNPNIYSHGVVLYDECPVDCPGYIVWSGGPGWVTCPSGYTDLQMLFTNLPAGTYYFPVMAEDVDANPQDFGFDICVEECEPLGPGNTCEDPKVVSLNKAAPGDTLYADYGQTTCGRLNDYSGTTCLGYYDGGEDMIYQVNVTTAVDVDIKVDPKGTTYGGVAIDAVCPPGATCMAFASGYSGPYIIMGLHLDPGTYYIMVDTWPSPDCIPDFDLFIIESEGATAGNNCSDPALITLPADMPYSGTNHTCGRGHDYDGITCLGYYDGGEDMIYEVTVTEEANVSITLDPKTTTYTGIALDSSCPPGATCMYMSTNSGASPHGFNASLSAGTYYIMVDTWPSPDCIPEFELTIDTAGTAPENDTCGGAPVISTFPTTVYGTTVGATIDCPGVLDWDAVWYRFDVPYATNNVFVDFCPTGAYIATVGIVLYGECPPDCPAYMLATGYQWVTCPSGFDDPQIWWNNMPGPASYWFPVYVEPGKKGAMDFGFEVSVEEATPCSVTCPPGGYDEGEGYCYDDYDDTYNGGCNSTPFVFQQLACGDTICGSCGVFDYFGSTYRDMDWFEVDVSEGDLTLTCVAEFPLALWLFDPGSFNCVDLVNLAFMNTANTCDTISVSAYVTPGTYWLIIAPMDWGPYPCGDQSEYVAWLDCTPFGPQMAVDPSTMYPVLNPSGDCSTADEDLVISSVGGEDLTYSIVENPAVDWMELSSYSGTVPPGNSDVLTTSFDATGMAAGDYYCDLEIDHNDPGMPDPYVVAVHLEVELAPEIDLPVRLWVPVVPDCETVYPLRIGNLGEGTLDFQISVSQNPPAPAAAKSSIRQALEALEQARESDPSLTPREAVRTIGAKKSAIDYHSTGTSEGLLFTAGAGKQVEILVVDDDGGLPNGSYSDIEYAYLDALDANALVYDYYLVDWIDPLANGPDLATMQNYSCIIWFTGETWGYYGDDTVTPTDENNLAAFLDGGGNLFLSAQDYLWDRYPSAGSFSSGQFPYDYLGLSQAMQDAYNDPYTVYGGAGSVADGMQFDADRCFATNPDVPLWTDVILGQGSFMNVLLVWDTDPSAVQYDGGNFKTVFTTTEFCGLLDGTPSYRADLMASIMDWFGCGGGGPACPFTVDPEEGEVPPESFFDVSLTFDGTLFEECVDETLTCYLSVASNDCDEPLLTVDIHALSARGDVTGDCTIDIADVVFLLNYVFFGSPAPDPMCIGDLDRDGDVDSDDALYLISYLFEYGAPPEIPAAPIQDQTPFQLK